MYKLHTQSKIRIKTRIKQVLTDVPSGHAQTTKNKHKIKKLTQFKIVEDLLYSELNHSCQERNSNLRELSLMNNKE